MPATAGWKLIFTMAAPAARPPCSRSEPPPLGGRRHRKFGSRALRGSNPAPSVRRPAPAAPPRPRGPRRRPRARVHSVSQRARTPAAGSRSLLAPPHGPSQRAQGCPAAARLPGRAHSSAHLLPQPRSSAGPRRGRSPPGLVLSARLHPELRVHPASSLLPRASPSTFPRCQSYPSARGVRGQAPGGRPCSAPAGGGWGETRRAGNGGLRAAGKSRASAAFLGTASAWRDRSPLSPVQAAVHRSCGWARAEGRGQSAAVHWPLLLPVRSWAAAVGPWCPVPGLGALAHISGTAAFKTDEARRKKV